MPIAGIWMTANMYVLDARDLVRYDAHLRRAIRER